MPPSAMAHQCCCAWAKGTQSSSQHCTDVWLLKSLFFCSPFHTSAISAEYQLCHFHHASLSFNPYFLPSSTAPTLSPFPPPPPHFCSCPSFPSFSDDDILTEAVQLCSLEQNISRSVSKQGRKPLSHASVPFNTRCRSSCPGGELVWRQRGEVATHVLSDLTSTQELQSSREERSKQFIQGSHSVWKHCVSHYHPCRVGTKISQPTFTLLACLFWL